MHILSADGQPRVRSAIRLLLEQQPEANVVEEVANAQELLKHVGNRCPDVLLLDWELPGLTPEKLLGTLHTIYPDLFIIVLDSKPQTRQVALEAGADGFVSKNDPPERLLAAIESFKDLDKKEIRRDTITKDCRRDNLRNAVRQLGRSGLRTSAFNTEGETQKEDNHGQQQNKRSDD
jgi:CheY-like chemotaxis protein